MPWTPLTLNDARSIPPIAYGSAFRGGGHKVKSLPACIRDAYKAGFRHFDTSEVYDNEDAVGEGISTLPRSDIFITTKWGIGPASRSIRTSLEKLRVTQVDLYMIHQPNHLPRLPHDDIPALWREMEQIRDEGLAGSIGVGNFDIDQLKVLLESTNTVPAVNQISFNPLEYADPNTRALLAFHKEHGIQTEGYGAIQPVTKWWEHIVGVVSPMATSRGVDESAVLQAWARSKGVLIVTTSSSLARMEAYIAGGDIVLSDAEIKAIDQAGEAQSQAQKQQRSEQANQYLMPLNSGARGHNLTIPMHIRQKAARGEDEKANQAMPTPFTPQDPCLFGMPVATCTVAENAGSAQVTLRTCDILERLATECDIAPLLAWRLAHGTRLRGIGESYFIPKTLGFER